MPKTNAVRVLDRLKIVYQLREYEVDPEDLSAETVARKVGLPLPQVFKTLVVRGDRHGVFFAVVPGDAQLDRKAAARLSGDSKADPVALKEVQPLTGYVRGGVTVFAAKKDYPVLLDESALGFAVVSVSAGIRGTQIFLAPADYARAASARIGPLARREGESVGRDES